MVSDTVQVSPRAKQTPSMLGHIAALRTGNAAAKVAAARALKELAGTEVKADETAEHAAAGNGSRALPSGVNVSAVLALGAHVSANLADRYGIY